MPLALTWVLYIMDYRCPICGEDESTPGIKLMFSVCSHQVCEKCLKTLFRNDTEVNCPICERLLKRPNFSNKYQEDLEMERDREVRIRIFSVYPTLLSSQVPENCTLPEYNDYLEMVEDLIEDIMSQRNTEKIKEKMDLDKETRKGRNLKIEARRNELKKEFYDRALVADAMFNETLREEADRIQNMKSSEPEEKVIIKNMPDKCEENVRFT